jgi:hypothetical protein
MSPAELARVIDALERIADSLERLEQRLIVEIGGNDEGQFN